MKLHTVFVTYNRLELTKQAISSYLETVGLPFTYIVVDNASTDGTWSWLANEGHPHAHFGENLYPGPACNHGWAQAPDDATHLHRADNDFAFLPGWCEEVERCFGSTKIGQLGLRTRKEESSLLNVGGNNIIRRDLWDKGLRYDERPWSEYPAGHTEDSMLSPAVKGMGYHWRRVARPCIRSLAPENPNDPYYIETWTARGILDSALAAHGIVRDP